MYISGKRKRFIYHTHFCSNNMKEKKYLYLSIYIPWNVNFSWKTWAEIPTNIVWYLLQHNFEWVQEQGYFINLNNTHNHIFAVIQYTTGPMCRRCFTAIQRLLNISAAEPGRWSLLLLASEHTDIGVGTI